MYDKFFVCTLLETLCILNIYGRTKDCLFAGFFHRKYFTVSVRETRIFVNLLSLNFPMCLVDEIRRISQEPLAFQMNFGSVLVCLCVLNVTTIRCAKKLKREKDILRKPPNYRIHQNSQLPHDKQITAFLLKGKTQL